MGKEPPGLHKALDYCLEDLFKIQIERIASIPCRQQASRKETLNLKDEKL